MLMRILNNVFRHFLYSKDGIFLLNILCIAAFFELYQKVFFFSDECEYGIDEFGLHANSREDYWSELNSRIDTNLNMTNLVRYVDIWDGKQKNWHSIFLYYVLNQTRVNQLFR